jgi:major vault protein
MLNHEEELWEKDLPPVVEQLLVSVDEPSLQGTRDRAACQVEKKRDRTQVITFRVPHNAAVQIYDYKEKKARSVARIASG